METWQELGPLAAEVDRCATALRDAAGAHNAAMKAAREGRPEGARL